MIKMIVIPKLKLQKHIASILFTLLLVSTVILLFPKAEIASAAPLAFGKNTVGGSTDTVTQGNVFGSKFIAPDNGTITSVTAYIYSFNAGQAQIMIFSDTNGAPNALLVSSGIQNIIEAAQWVNFQLSLPITQGSTYWICVNAVSSGGVIYYYDQGQTNQFVTGIVSATNIFQNPTFASNVMSIYATYTSSSSPTPTPSPPPATSTPTPTSTPPPQTTPTPTVTSTPTPSASSTPSAVPNPTETPAQTPNTSPSPTAISPAPKATPTEAPSASPSNTQTPAPTPQSPSSGFPATEAYAAIAAVVVVVIALAAVMLLRRKRQS